MIAKHVQNLVQKALAACSKDGTFKEPCDLEIELEAPKVAAHGDLATNIAMIIASKEGKKPREIAEAIVQHLPKDDDTIQKVTIAGPGFINFAINPARYIEQLVDVFNAGEQFGVLSLGKGKAVQVEFVSANPTGPLHIGHGRGAVFGDVLGNVLRAAGYDVTKEYYVNDAGNQIATLGRSVYFRILELDGEKIEFPEDCYQGAYITDIARELRAKDHKTVTMLSEGEAIAHCGEFASKKILDEIKRDLAETGIIHDQYFHENALHTDSAVERSTLELEQKGFVFEKDGALWFNATAFGDDKDRVFKKSDGSYTYFAADIAYHKNKFDRGFDRVIDIWGADHGGYVPRMRAAIEAMGHQPNQFDVVLIQLVNLVREGKMVSMSTRAGKYETLEDVRREVGKDVCRYFFLTRSHNAQLDFDLELARKTTPENPVFYIQYAHARISSVFKKAQEEGISFEPKTASLDKLDLPEEVNLAKLIAAYPDVIRECAEMLEPHKLAFYLLELARSFQSYYSRGRDDARYRMISDDAPRTQAKLYLAKCVQIVLQNALKVLGISAPERMDREGDE